MLLILRRSNLLRLVISLGIAVSAFLLMSSSSMEGGKGFGTSNVCKAFDSKLKWTRDLRSARDWLNTVILFLRRSKNCSFSVISCLPEELQSYFVERPFFPIFSTHKPVLEYVEIDCQTDRVLLYL